MVRTVVRALRAALKTRTRPPAAPRSRSGDAHFGDGSRGGSSLRLLADVSGATWRACRAHAPPPCPHITWIARAAPVFLCGSAEAVARSVLEWRTLRSATVTRLTPTALPTPAPLS